MNKKIISLMAAVLALLSAVGQEVEFTGYGRFEPFDTTLSVSHGSLNKVYVLYDTVGVGMTYRASTNDPVTWSTFKIKTSESESIDAQIIHEGRVTRLPQVRSNMGYIITEGTTPHYYWVVNYAQYYLSLNSISCNEGNPCQLLSFNIDGQADAIPYREVDGQRHVLDREIKLIYNTLEWDDSTTCWDDKVVVESFEYLDDNIQITQPLCDTEFTLTGDRFLRYWNLEEQSITSEYYNTQAVSVHTTAIQEIRNNDNEQGQNNNGENSQGRAFSGSAPIHIVFTGYPSDENLWGVWEMATDAEFEDIIRTDYQNELDITFEDYGTYYLRYRIEGVCEVTDEPYTVTVDAPDIKCSNVFAPHGNDMWKVNYESLIDFHCWIFNRWGNLVFEYTDPGSGWDGKYRGSLVDAGVYYYVITYTGSDRVRKTKRGDITVLRPKKGVSGSSSGTGTTEGDIGDSVE